MTSASTVVETMSKSSVRYVHQMAIYRVCNISLFFLNSPSELTFWITLVYDGPLVNDWQNILDLGGWSEMMMKQHPTHFDPEHRDVFSGMLTFFCKCHNPKNHILNLKTCHLCYHFSILLNDPSTDFVNCVPVNLECGIAVVCVTKDYRNFLTAFYKPLIWYVLTCCIWLSSGLFTYIKSNQGNENIYTLLIMA
jgi:hypothetical protein